MAVINKRIRKMYGRSQNGSRSRETIRATITTDTMSAMRSLVDVKKGGYGSAFIELSIRLMVSLVSAPGEVNGIDRMEWTANELEHVVESPYFQQNIEKLGRLLKV